MQRTRVLKTEFCNLHAPTWAHSRSPDTPLDSQLNSSESQDWSPVTPFESWATLGQHSVVTGVQNHHPAMILWVSDETMGEKILRMPHSTVEMQGVIRVLQ